MARILFLTHRLPYPPNKGDKVRSYHLLRHLAQRHEVVLGTFVDDPDDEPLVGRLDAWCREMKTVRLRPRRRRLASLTGLLRGEPLTLAYYRSSELKRWVDRSHRARPFDACVVFSSAMAPYAAGLGVPMLVDFVDLDSAKWSAYAALHRWPMSWIYRREGRALLEEERRAAASAMASYFVTKREVDLFRLGAPEYSGALHVAGNGVDARYFRRDPGRPSPFPDEDLALVFTGAMDYLPNIDAVHWFAEAVLPLLTTRWPTVKFYIVGRRPTSAVRALQGARVAVTGAVPDVRPYLQHAAVVVAPMRLARGIHNKVLEAMAMACPIVATTGCIAALECDAELGVAPAGTAEQFAIAIDGLLHDPSRARELGATAERAAKTHFQWSSRLAPIGQHVDAIVAEKHIR